jgi:hypothetical protein
MSERIKIKPSGKGHDVFIDGDWIFWVIGSEISARKELRKFLLKQQQLQNDENK